MRDRLSRAVCALGAGLALFAVVALAQSPATNRTDADYAKEQQQQQQRQPLNNQPVWSEVRSGQPQYTSIPGRETNVLIQPQGQTWRALRNGELSVWGGWGLVGMLLLIGAFYALRGRIELNDPPTGRKIRRFSDWERIVHWATAGSFVVLSISGLIILFGKNLLLPIIGYTLFSWLAQLAKSLHNFVGPLFVVCVILLVVTFARQNLPRAGDLKWLMAFGGLLRKNEVPSHKFNAGEKIWFWGGALVLGTIISVTGLILDFPNFDQTRGTMQLANVVHLIATALFMMGAFAHIYIGTIGMQGAIDGMKTGYVDETWAKEHHEYWYNEVKAGRLPADGGSSGTGTAAPMRERPA